MNNKSLPSRMCVCCRNMKDKKNLLRIVKNKENQLFVDLTGKANGRGAYICDDKECIEKLKKQKILNKVFKIQVSDVLYEEVINAINSKS